jgi:ATP-dependent RNA helicase DeaD
MSHALPSFTELGLAEPILRALRAVGYANPTPIQAKAIPPALDGRDVLGCARTGTGKTAAFVLPMLQLLGEREGRPERRVRALVLAPTRELAAQIGQCISDYAVHTKLRHAVIFGGVGAQPQIAALRRGVEILVATPGRLEDLMSQGHLRLDGVEMLVLDEFDRMLDQGFIPSIRRIVGKLPARRQTLLFSATVPKALKAEIDRLMDRPVSVAVDEQASTPDLVLQSVHFVEQPEKRNALQRILREDGVERAVVFTRTKHGASRVARQLSTSGIEAEAIHGDRTQGQRERTLARFRDGKLRILVATDVAARGLDIGHVSHVVNYDVPSNPDAYVHRIGRTGRAGREGVAITLVEPREHRLLANIERAVRARLEVGRIPTVADLRERRLELLRASLREALLEEPSLDRYRGVIEPLCDEFDVVNVALAAVRLADRAGGDREADEADIAPASLHEVVRPAARAPRPPVRGGRPGDGGPGLPGRARRSAPTAPWTRLFIGGGRRMGLRPGDLVGAITGEAGIAGSSVGAIQIADAFSIVEVPEPLADDVVRALRAATIKGRRFPVRRDREG